MTREEAAAKLRDKAADPYYVPRLRELYQLAAEALSEPEIIHCMACRYWTEAKVNEKGFLICPASGMEITECDFCSYAERRTEDAGENSTC